MNRQIVYANEIFLNTDFLNQVINNYISSSKIIEVMFGTSQQFAGLNCVPTSPASLSVVIEKGQIFQLAPVDTQPYGSLPADAHEIVKQAVLLDPLTFALTPPVSTGNEVKYLIQGALETVDATPTSRAFYNNAGTNGLPAIIQNVSSLRSDKCEIQLKQGVAAPIGTAITPAPDDGFMGMWVITVSHGQTTITASNIALYPGAPQITNNFSDFITEPVADIRYAQKIQVQTNGLIYSVDSGTANNYVASPSPAITTYTAGLEIKLKIANTNTGASVVNVNSLGNKNIKLLNGNDPNPGDIPSGLVAVLIYDGVNFQLQNPATSVVGFTTGDAKLTLKTTADNGWVLSNDGTIGNASSSATTRANADTASLFEFLWNTFSDAIAPVSSGRGASAAADFAANKTIQLLRIAGRALAVPGSAIVKETFTASTSTSELTVADTSSFYAGTAVTLTTSGTLPAPLALATNYYVINVDATHIKLATSRANAVAGTAITLTTTGTGTHNVIITMPNRALGSFTGEPTHTNLINEMPAHSHPGSTAPGSSNDSGSGHCEFQSNNDSTAPLNIASQGGSGAHNNMQPSVFLNVMIKL